MKDKVETKKDSVAPGATAVAGPFPDPVRHDSGDETANNTSLPSRQSIATATLVQNECIVVAEPIGVDDVQRDSTNTPRKQVAIAFLIIIVVAIIGCLLVVLPGTQPTQNMNPEADESDAFQSLLRRESMIEALADISEYGTESFNVDSPFFSSDRMAALDWIVDSDPKQLPIPDLDETDDLLNSTKAEMLRKLRQRYVAALFYFATNGDDWFDKFEFLSGFDECEWNTIVGFEYDTWSNVENKELKGLFCSKEGWIMEYIFWWNNLSGTLPREMGSATRDAFTINVAGGSISGTIPSSLTKLFNLKTLALSENCFTGVVPTGLVSDRTMPNLQVLTLHNNVNLKGNLNGKCDGSGTGKAQGVIAVSADCPVERQLNENTTEGIFCDCCICCDRDLYECTDLESGYSYSFMHKGLTKDSVMHSSTIQCISSEQKQFIRSECPCIVRNLVNPAESFLNQCTKNCTEYDATPSHNFGFG